MIGNRAFPAPLSRDEEQSLARLALDGNSDARAVLVAHNMALVVHIAKKYACANMEMEDLVQIGAIGLLKAIDTFKPDSGYRLSTYAGRCVANAILMELRKVKRRGVAVSLDTVIFEDKDGSELTLLDTLGTEPDIVSHSIEAAADVLMIRKAVKRLPDLQRNILAMRYGEKPCTQDEAAKRLGLSQSYVSRQEKKAIRQLQTEMRCAL